MKGKDPSLASRAGAAQRLADKRDQTKRMTAFYDYSGERLRARMEANLSRRSRAIMERVR